MAVRILIGADVAPTESNRAAFAAGNAGALLQGGLLDRFLEADARIFDLEIPLFDGNAPIPKNGPALKAPEAAINGLAALRPSLVTLANNHILDHGAAGLEKTAALLSERGLPFVGAGRDLTAAAKPYILCVGGMRIGVYACAEHEFSAAGENAPGANPFDALEDPDRIRALKRETDAVIVLYHGGPEGWGYPTPNLQKRLRKLASSGADLVVCQHGHCVGCMETYGASTIVYGQGNFLFDAADGEPCWDTGLLIELTLGDGPIRTAFLPIRRAPGGVKLAEGEDANAILSGFYDRSGEIKTPGAVEIRTRERAAQLSRYFGRTLIGDSLLMRGMNALTGRKPLNVFYDGASKRRLINCIDCETLRELFSAALERD